MTKQQEWIVPFAVAALLGVCGTAFGHDETAAEPSPSGDAEEAEATAEQPVATEAEAITVWGEGRRETNFPKAGAGADGAFCPGAISRRSVARQGPRETSPTSTEDGAVRSLRRW